MIYSLPRDDDQGRKDELKEQQEKYRFNYEKFNYVTPNPQYPMADEIPFEDNSLTKPDWTVDVVSLLLRILANQSLFDSEIKKGSLCRFILYFRLNRLINNSKHKGLIERLYKAILSIRQVLLKLFGQTPKSEDIKYDVEHNKINQVEKRIESMIKDINKNALKRESNLDSFEDYKKLFQIIYLPYIADHVLEDRDFAAQRVAGANPVLIQRLETMLDNFPITDKHYKSVMGEDDSLNKSLEEGRLYINNYKDLKIIKVDPNSQKYLYMPIALFAIEAGNSPNRRLIPVAIQCDQDYSEKNNPIITSPNLKSSDSERWMWQFAKLMVQIADGNYHELVSHLGQTHLLIEPIVIATHRQLSSKHPLKALLLPHFEGTLFINDFAVSGLINEGGIVDKVLAGTLDSSLTLSIEAAKGFPFSFNESFLPKTFKHRKVDDSKLFPDYPYRDDSILIWEAIHAWVSSYLKLYYTSDKDVKNDIEIQSWLAELISQDGGKMLRTGIGEVDESGKNPVEPQIRTLNYLIDATSHIIFTSSAQHAAVNFTQSTLMTYMPNMPLSAYKKDDNTAQSIQALDKKEYFSVLPSQAQSEVQMNITYLLGSVYYTKLGHYEGEYFKDHRINEHLDKFKSRLIEIEKIIDQRNESRPTYYNVLKPSKIPQSINI